MYGGSLTIHRESGLAGCPHPRPLPTEGEGRRVLSAVPPGLIGSYGFASMVWFSQGTNFEMLV